MQSERVLHGIPYWDPHWNCYVVGEIGDQTVSVMDFIFTSAIILIAKDNPLCYDDRWCYHTKAAAITAACLWLEGDEREPKGWHRHPHSGRRRPEGKPEWEYVTH